MAGSQVQRTEELFAATTLLNDLDQTGLQLFDRRDVLCEDTHFSGLGGNVNLDTVAVEASARVRGLHRLQVHKIHFEV